MLSRVPVEFSDKIKLNIKNNLLIINSIKVWQEISEYIDRRGVKSMLSQIQVLARSDLYTNFRARALIISTKTIGSSHFQCQGPLGPGTFMLGP